DLEAERLQQRGDPPAAVAMLRSLDLDLTDRGIAQGAPGPEKDFGGQARHVDLEVVGQARRVVRDEVVDGPDRNRLARRIAFPPLRRPTLPLLWPEGEGTGGHDLRDVKVTNPGGIAEAELKAADLSVQAVQLAVGGEPI